LAIFQQAITSLITTREPALIGHALYWMDRFALVLLIVEAMKAMGSGGTFQDRWFSVVQTLMFITFARTLLVFYDAPLPGVGISFSNIITDESAYLVNLLDTNSLERLHGHLDLIWQRIAAPSYLAWFSLIIYCVLLAVIFLAKMLSLFVVSFGFVASAVCGLLGPLFIPSLIWKPMSWLFWGWLRAFMQYSCVPVVAVALLMVFEQFIGQFATTLPPHVAVADYSVYVYASIVMIGTMALGIASVPGLTASIFSGHLHHGGSGGGMLVTLLMRR
jgi:hypothetical protein